MADALAILGGMGSMLARIGAQQQQARTTQQFEADKQWTDRLLKTADEAAKEGSVEFFSNPEGLKKKFKPYLSDDAFDQAYTFWTHTAQANRNRMDTQAAISAMSARLGQTQQAGRLLAPNAVPALVEAGTKAGVSPKDLESYGLNIGPTKAQEAGAATTATEKAKLALAPQEAAAAGMKTGAEETAKQRAEAAFAPQKVGLEAQKAAATEAARVGAHFTAMKLNSEAQIDALPDGDPFKTFVNANPDLRNDIKAARQAFAATKRGAKVDRQTYTNPDPKNGIMVQYRRGIDINTGKTLWETKLGIKPTKEQAQAISDSRLVLSQIPDMNAAADKIAVKLKGLSLAQQRRQIQIQFLRFDPSASKGIGGLVSRSIPGFSEPADPDFAEYFTRMTSAKGRMGKSIGAFRNMAIWKELSPHLPDPLQLPQTNKNNIKTLTPQLTFALDEVKSSAEPDAYHADTSGAGAGPETPSLSTDETF